MFRNYFFFLYRIVCDTTQEWHGFICSFSILVHYFDLRFVNSSFIEQTWMTSLSNGNQNWSNEIRANSLSILSIEFWYGTVVGGGLFYFLVAIWTWEEERWFTFWWLQFYSWSSLVLMYLLPFHFCSIITEDTVGGTMMAKLKCSVEHVTMLNSRQL